MGNLDQKINKLLKQSIEEKINVTSTITIVWK